jgi:hypothetical protein
MSMASSVRATGSRRVPGRCPGASRLEFRGPDYVLSGPDESLSKGGRLLALISGRIARLVSNQRPPAPASRSIPRLGLIGSCGLRISNVDRGQASFGCELGREFWGHGYAIEAARGLVGFAFSELGVQRIEAETLARIALQFRWLAGSGCG